MAKALITPEKALKKAESYCAYQERSQQEVRDKIYSWGLHRKDVEGILSNLIATGFLKEERFAIAFAGGKFRIKKWGRNKIKLALKEKKVSDPLIRKALDSIDDTDYRKVLEKIIRERMRKVADENVLRKRYKVASYVIGRGFEPELVWEILHENSGS